MTKHTILSILAAFAAIILSVSSCGNKAKGPVKDILDLQQELLNATTDSTVSVADAYALFQEYADTLLGRATAYGENLGLRVDAQKRAGIAMSLAAMKISDPALLEQITEEFNRVQSIWIINDDKKNPEMYKEIYCVTDNGMDDCVMLDLSFDANDPTKVDGGVVWFPNNAKTDIEVVFANMKEDKSEPDFDNAIFSEITGIAPEGTLAAGSPLAAKLSKSFYDNLKNYEFVFVGYTSKSDNPESFVLSLDTLHEQLKHVTGPLANQ